MNEWNTQPRIKLAATICKLRWREVLCVLAEETTQCPRPGLEPGPFDPETNTNTKRALHLHSNKNNFIELMQISIYKLHECLKNSDIDTMTHRWLKIVLKKNTRTRILHAD